MDDPVRGKTRIVLDRDFLHTTVPTPVIFRRILKVLGRTFSVKVLSVTVDDNLNDGGDRE